eukprot:4029201-Pyramimonas_sp.AAC.1
MPPRGSQETIKRPQEASQRHPRCLGEKAKIADLLQSGPKMAPKAQKSAPRQPHEVPRRPQEAAKRPPR